MTMLSPAPRAALILETNNLRGGDADEATVVRSASRLLTHLGRQSLPLARLAEVVITHDGLSAASQHALERASGRPLTFVTLPPGTDYYEAKNLGFDASTAEVVVFGDSDCWPCDAWLETLIAPFVEPTVRAVSGRTTYRADLLGTAATTIDFMYFPSPLAEGCTRNFYANNVAFRRELFAAHRYRRESAIYRGPCQVLGLELQAAQIAVRFVPRARTVHRFPDSRRQLIGLRLHRGQDAALFSANLADHYLPRGLGFLGRLGPVSAVAVLGARLGFSLRALGQQDMPATRGPKWLAAVGLIGAISALDTVGGIAGGLRQLTPWRARERSNAVLGYHGDDPHLRAA